MNRSLSMNKLDEARTSPNEERARPNEKELERWAAEIAGLLHQAPPAPKSLGLPDASVDVPVPEVWQQGVGAVTLGELERPGAPPAVHEVSASTTEGALDQQLQVRVKTEEFGEIAVVIERLRTGLRVLIGAEDAKAASALSAQSQSVRQALESEGQNVQIVEVVRMQGNGTRFASNTGATNRRPRHSQQTDSAQTGSGQPRRKTKRVNLNG